MNDPIGDTARVDPRRPHRADPRAGDRRPLPRASTCSSRSPGSPAPSLPPQQMADAPSCAGCMAALPRRQGPHRDRRVRWPAPTRSSTARGTRAARSRRSCSRPWTSRRPPSSWALAAADLRRRRREARDRSGCSRCSSCAGPRSASAAPPRRRPRTPRPTPTAGRRARAGAAPTPSCRAGCRRATSSPRDAAADRRRRRLGRPARSPPPRPSRPSSSARSGRRPPSASGPGAAARAAPEAPARRGRRRAARRRRPRHRPRRRDAARRARRTRGRSRRGPGPDQRDPVPASSPAATSTGSRRLGRRAAAARRTGRRRRRASPTARATGDRVGDAVVAEAQKYLGVPYMWGGTDPVDGPGLLGPHPARLRTSASSCPGSPRPGHGRHAGRLAGRRPARRPRLLRLPTARRPRRHLHRQRQDDRAPRTPASRSRCRTATPPPSAACCPRPQPTAAGRRPTGGRGPAPACPTPSSSPGRPAATASTPAARRRRQARVGLRPAGRIRAGAQGLMQFMPATARASASTRSTRPGRRRRRPLPQRPDKQFGSADLALAAYNAGPGAVQPLRRGPALRRDPELRPQRDEQGGGLPMRLP